MLSPRSLLVLAVQLLLIICVAGRPEALRQDVSDAQAKRVQDLKNILDQLNPSRFLGQALNGQLALEQSDAALLPGRSQKRAVHRKRQNGTDTTSDVAVTTTNAPPATTSDPVTTTDAPPAGTTPEPSTTTVAPPTSSQGETGSSSSLPPSSNPPPSSSSLPTPPSSSDVPTQAPAPTTPVAPTQAPAPTQEPAPTQAPAPTTQAPPSAGTTSVAPPVVLPPSGGDSTTAANPGNTGSGNTGGGNNNPTSQAPAAPPPSIVVPITTTDNQGNTFVTSTLAPAPTRPPTGSGSGSGSNSDAPSSFAGEIDVVTTDNEGQPITLSSVSFGEVLTTTGRGGRTFITTYTPGGGRVSRLVLQTTTLPNGERSTITSFAPVAQATVDPTSAGARSSTSAAAGLQSGAAVAPNVIDGRLAAVAGGLWGLAQLL